jgi:hypothetical protein
MTPIPTLFVANRNKHIEIVYYCPTCEAINELVGRNTDRLLCRECRSILTATDAALELLQPRDENRPDEGPEFTRG